MKRVVWVCVGAWSIISVGVNVGCRTPAQVNGTKPHVTQVKPPKADDDLPGALNSSQVHVKWLEKLGDGVRPVMEMGSDSARLDRKSQSGKFTGARVQLYDQGMKAARLTAKSVVAVESKHQLQAEGGVILRSLDPPGVTVRADRAVWLYKEGRIIARGHVTMVDQTSGDAQPTVSGGPWPTMSIDTAMKSIQVP